RPWIKFLRRSRTSDATGIFSARPLRNARRGLRRTTRKHCLQLFRDRRFVFVILRLAPGGSAFALPGALLLVSQTFLLRAVNGIRRDEDSLPFVAFPGARPPH